MKTFQKTRSEFRGMISSLSKNQIAAWGFGCILCTILFVSCNEDKQIAPQPELHQSDPTVDLPPSDDDEGTRHVSLEGPDKSKYVPGTYKHVYLKGTDKSRYVPDTYKHNHHDGPDKSKYVPESYEHAFIDGPDKSKYVPGDYKHAFIGGPDKSKYVPGDYKHVFIGGPDKSRYVPKDYIHNDKGYGQDDSDYSKFVPRK